MPGGSPSGRPNVSHVKKGAHGGNTVSPVLIERVDFVDIPARDVERAIAFYRDLLGLPQNPH